MTTATIREEITLQVPFFDVDALNIVWHGHYCKYMELARCQLLDKIGFSYTAMAESGFSFPVVDLHIKYIKPLVFEQTVRVCATLVEWQYRLKIAYRFIDAHSGEKLTTAHTVQAAVALSTGQLRFECPPALVQQVEKLLHSGDQE